MLKSTNWSLERILLCACLLGAVAIAVGSLISPGAPYNSKTSSTQADTAPIDLPDGAPPPPIQPGTPAVSFASTTVDGKNFVLNSRSGNIKIVEFWATWCGPCRMSIPAMEMLSKSLKDKGVEVIGVSVDTNTAANVAPLVKSAGMTYPVLVNQSNLAIASSKYSVTTFPSVFIIDGKGIIRWSFSGYWPDEEPYIRQVIGEIQSGQPVNQQ